MDLWTEFGRVIAWVSAVVVALRGFAGFGEDIIRVWRRVRDRVICRLNVIPLPAIITVDHGHPDGPRRIIDGAVNIRIDNRTESPLRVGKVIVQVRRNMRYHDLSPRIIPSADAQILISPYDSWTADFERPGTVGDHAAHFAREVRNQRVTHRKVTLRPMMIDTVDRRYKGKRFKFEPDYWLEGVPASEEDLD